MKFYFILICSVLSINTFSQKIKHVTWDDILLERSIEELHNILSKSRDSDERKFLENHLLISEDGYLMDSKYFSYATKKLKKKNLDRNMLCNKKVFNKAFKLLKTNGFPFLKATVKFIHFDAKNEYHVFFETMKVSKTKEYGINFIYLNTFAVFVYKWNDNLNNGTYELVSVDVW